MQTQTSGTSNTVQNQISDINQSFKERDVQEKAKKLGLPYVNLINIPLNPDYAKFVSQEDSGKANTVVFFKSGKKIKLAVVDPDDNDLKLLSEKLKEQGYEVFISLCSAESIKNAQKIYFKEKYKKTESLENIIEEQDLGAFVEEIKNLEELHDKIESSTYDIALNYIQVGGYKTKASDIHFQPEVDHILVRFRIDGILQPVFDLSRGIYDGIIKQIKHLSHLKFNVTNIPQDGQYSFIVNGRQINVRVSIVPSHYGETCVMRLLDSKGTFETFENLGFEGEALKNIKDAINLPHGMILVSGPTGSGKTTTMYSMLQSVDTKAKKVITLEDPIEYNLQGVTQSQVDPEIDYTFASGLRAILRQDPDIIMVGEIRDPETAETAAQASITGHLVISTLHTNSAVEAIPRLVNMGVKSYILAPALELIVAQRLVRKLCPDCMQTKPMTDMDRGYVEHVLKSIQEKGVQAPLTYAESKNMEQVLQSVQANTVPAPVMPNELKSPKGCEKCGNTGYRGQIAIAEVLRFTDDLKNMMLENKSMPEIYAYIKNELKMVTMLEDGVLKVLKGITTLDEVYRVAAV